jgi:hypothetical protein
MRKQFIAPALSFTLLLSSSTGALAAPKLNLTLFSPLALMVWKRQKPTRKKRKCIQMLP